MLGACVCVSISIQVQGSWGLGRPSLRFSVCGLRVLVGPSVALIGVLVG